MIDVLMFVGRKDMWVYRSVKVMLLAVAWWGPFHAPALAQVPGLCSPPNDPAQQASYGRLPTMSDAELRAYLATQGYGGPIGDGRPLPAVTSLESAHPALAGSPSLRSQSWIPHSVSTAHSPHAAASGIHLISAEDPLSSMGPDASREAERQERRQEVPLPAQGSSDGVDPHAEVFALTQYPSAIQCAKCHQKIYDEWRVSGHAYASVSPMFHRFEQLVNDLTQGTSGTFCLRCHAPIATQLNVPRYASLLEGPHILREGISCIVCHRVVERYGRVNGERRVESGTIYDPVVGNSGGDGIPAVLADAENWKVSVDPKETRPLQAIHRASIQFEQLADSSFCAGCHQVLVQPGIALEIVYQQYRAGPAYRKGTSCQDCHMGAVPGKALGYPTGACAEVAGKTYRQDRKHSNHIFYGPGYPIAHPGIFPHNEKSLRWSPAQWLEFDWRAGWGTESFEKEVANSPTPITFPPAWANVQERRDARKIIESNQQLLALKRQTAHEVLANGSRIDGPFFDKPPTRGRDLQFRYVVHNLSEGHNMPSGSLGAQPQLWLNAVLIDPQGRRVWESGDLDQHGDLRDLHSQDVYNRRVPPDLQLLNLQTKFLTTNVKGTEREMYLPVNVDIDPLPFFRPGPVPYTVLNHPPFIRMESRSIPPVDSKTANFTVPATAIKLPGSYRLSVRLRSRVEPAYFVRFVKGTPDMLRSMNEGIIDVHPYSIEFQIR